jgi:2-furoyl-CoA dehydrogenase FAD binding subunit
MKPAPFAYIRPQTKAEALAALAEHGDDAVVLAGGLSLGAMMNMRLVFAEIVIDINKLTDLDYIGNEGDWLHTGAMLRQADALASPEIAGAVPLLREGLRNVGHYQTRSRGTLGGSVAHADPSAEIPLCLATLGGDVELSSQRGTRRVAARDFAESALSTCRAGDEMITALHWPIQDRSGVAFREIAQRHGDFAIVAVAATARRDGAGFSYSLGFGGVEGRPRVLDGVAPDSNWDRFARDTVAAFVDTLAPMEDPRVSAAYRSDVSIHLGIETLLEALGKAA